MRASRGMVSVVVPTRDEAGNVGALIRRIGDIEGGVVGEIIFVDDSDDQTPDVVRRVAENCKLPVKLIHREPAERVGGLGSAVMQGIASASSDWVLVMDGDLQHPPEVIPKVVAAATDDVRAVVASRLLDAEAVANTTPLRRVVTKAATLITKALFPRRLSGITDPLTGFFLVDRRALPAGLAPDGFKILLEILVRSRNLNPSEVSFSFGDRVSGRSKASLEEGIRFAKLLARLRLSRPESASSAEKAPRARHRYSIHGILTIASDARLPELEYFRTEEQLDSPDLLVRLGRPRQSGPGAMEFKELFGWAGFAARIEHGEQIRIAASRLVGLSPHVLYTNVVEPVLRWEFVRRGYALVHSACVVDDGHAFLVTARTDTGKTTTALKLLEGGELDFLSDDLCIVTPIGSLLTYPKPMTMSHHTVQAVNPRALQFWEKVALQPQSRLHSRSGRRIGLGLAKSAFPAATANAVVQGIIPPPKYAVSRILPGTRTAASGVPQHLFVIARGPESKRGLSADEASEMLLANCEDAYGFPPYEHIEAFMLGQADEDLRARESEIIVAVVESCSATLLQSSSYGWADGVKGEIAADRSVRQAMDATREEPGDTAIVIDLTDSARQHPAPEWASASEDGTDEAAG